MNTSKFSFGSRYSISLVIFLTIFIVFSAADFSTACNKFIVINTNDEGPGSLRQAILDANNNPGKDNIVFDIPGAGPHTIQLTSGLPTIDDPVIIDGSTQNGANCNTWPPTLMIELDGSNAGGGVIALRITAGNSTIHGLVINRFDGDGIDLQDNGGNVIECNFIGTDVDGASDLGNGRKGVNIGQSSPDNRIGGKTPKARNLISGNDRGVHVYGSGATGNLIQGNFIGTDVTGIAAIGNGVGVSIENASDNIVGGNAAHAGNLISGNERGVWLIGPNNSVSGNYIGTDVTGTAALGNGDGVVIEGGAEFNTIGGTRGGERNIISGNSCLGIWILGANNTIVGNYIGTDVTGTDGIGNGTCGIWIVGANNIVGGRSSSAKNVISANACEGIEIGGDGANGNVVKGNFIGTDANGNPVLGNAWNGIVLHSNVSDNIIGGNSAKEGNVIAGNGESGIRILNDWSLRNRVQKNSIFSNSGLGIDLQGNGVTSNDAGDGDTGPNNLQNYPVLTSAILVADQLTVIGTIDTPDPVTVTLEFFASSASDPSGYGEGEDFLGSGRANYSGEFSVTLPYAAPGTFISATATDVDGNTSEFSKNKAVESGGGCPKPSIPEEVTEEQIMLPEAYGLSQNYPNPFNPETAISFQLPEASQVVLKIFNLLGEEVRTLANSPYQAGYHTIEWDGTDESGNSVSNGVYLYRIQAGSFSKIMKMSLLR